MKPMITDGFDYQLQRVCSYLLCCHGFVHGVFWHIHGDLMIQSCTAH